MVRQKDVFLWSMYSHAFLTGKKTQVSVDVGGGMIYRLELEDPPKTDEVMNDARDMIGENPDKMADTMKELFTKLAGNTKLNAPIDNAAWLVRFLRARKYDVSKTIELIHKYYEFKEENKDIYDGLIPSNEKDTFAKGILTVLPRRDQLGRRIIIARGGDWEGDSSETLKICRMTVALLEIGVYEPATQLTGLQFIVDMKGMGYEQFKKISISSIRTMIDWIKNSVPLTLQGVHIINKPSWFRLAEWTVLGIITKEIKDVFHVHNDFNSLHKMIDASSLPDTYGGAYPMYESITQDEWEVFLKHQDEEYETLDSYGFKSSNRLPRKNIQPSNANLSGLPVNVRETNTSQPITVS